MAKEVMYALIEVPSGYPLFVSRDKTILERYKVVLDNDTDDTAGGYEFRTIIPIPVVDSEPEKFFCVASFPIGEDLEDNWAWFHNYWFADCPYDKPFVSIDGTHFEVGTWVDSVPEATSIGREQYGKFSDVIAEAVTNKNDIPSERVYDLR